MPRNVDGLYFILFLAYLFICAYIVWAISPPLEVENDFQLTDSKDTVFRTEFCQQPD
jgi:hypothetical protein